MNAPKKTPWRLDPGQIEVVDEDVAELLKRKSTVERVAMINDAHRTVRTMLESFLKSRHPDWNPQQVQAEVVRRMLGELHA